jgi:hypothetical protein
LTRVEAGFGREGIADLVRDLGGRQCVHSPLDEDDIAGGADAETNLAGGLQITAGRTGGLYGLSAG